MAKYRLTVGMAVYDDLKGLALTIQALRFTIPQELLKQTQLIVSNNNATSADGQAISAFVHSVGADVSPQAFANNANRDQWRTDYGRYSFGHVHHLDANGMQGTAYPREQIFRFAEGEVVVCVDAHVILSPGTLPAILKYFDENPASQDLVHGPMLLDNLVEYHSKMTAGWGAGMYGKWGGDPEAAKVGGPAFEIPAMGLGLFSCRKNAWLGFSEQFCGFGGEEWYIHDKFRQAGRKVLCLPDAIWWHYFGDQSKIRPYDSCLEKRFWNYLVARRELGQPIDDVIAHFRETPMPETSLQQILAAPHFPGIPETAAKPAPVPPPVDGLPPRLVGEYAKAATTESDIYKHIPRLRELATQCQHVTEAGVRTAVSTTGLLAGLAGRANTTLVSYDINPSAQAAALVNSAGQCNFQFIQKDWLTTEIEETDLLFIDTLHTAKQLARELAKHAGKARRWIAFHDTHTYGENGEQPGEAGLLVPLRGFLQTYPEWFVVSHTEENNGFTVIGRQSADRPATPVQLPAGAAVFAVPTTAPDQGPGTELEALIAELGISTGAGCNCIHLRDQMNVWRADGCRKNFNTIVGQLKDNADKLGWLNVAAQVASAVARGAPFRLNPLKPFTSLVTEAIARADDKESEE